jgi:hypothetical protein
MHAQHLHREAEHLQRQTAALESIRSMLAFLTILTVVGVVLGAVAAFGV